MTFQRELVEHVGQDAWIVVCFSSLTFFLVIWMMYRVLNKAQHDIMFINQAYFGKWAGNLLNLLLLGYLLLVGGNICRTFIQIVQVWLFPDLHTWILCVILLLAACYAVFGGLRTVIGVCFFSMLQYMLLPIYFFIASYFHFSYFLPVMDHSVSEMVKAMSQMTFSFLGVEVILICYPWFKNPKKSERWVYWANGVVTLFYLSEIITSLAFFSKNQLINIQWPSLAQFQFVQLPYIERFEGFGVASQLMRALPILCLCLWSAGRISKVVTSIRPSRTVPFFAALLAIFVCLLPESVAIKYAHHWIYIAGTGIVYVYLPILFVLSLFSKKVKPA
ncbi:hypothetical protein A8709_15360 [Paenibacillus pectinilyticus]|uniref:Uncharacterized protein n=1 Tax=Paenibacillus pectinilyticus TaxID=512399 RepID=A0A1C1A4H2_9BACL|nr:hypothetical protein A8709_15360 [Paenibacillus pectinilyticus]